MTKVLSLEGIVSFVTDTVEKLIFSQAILLLLGLFFSKASLLLLLRDIFNINGNMRYLVWIGLITNFATYFTGIPIEAYYNAPSPGQSWYGLPCISRVDIQGYDRLNVASLCLVALHVRSILSSDHSSF